MRGRGLLVAVLPAVLLVACTPSAETATTELTTTPASPAQAPDLPALRVQYELPACPTTDRDVPAVEGGLPQTELPCIGEGDPVNLAGLPREPMVVNLWAQWCGPCREESPFLREAFQETTDVRFVGINYQDPQEDWAIEFAGLVGWRYPHVVDVEKTLQGPLRVPGLPVTLFVDADGVIAGRHVGPVTSTEQLQDLMVEHLGTS